jgi:CubicO group peptidase (beta-lactamase class C family)
MITRAGLATIALLISGATTTVGLAGADGRENVDGFFDVGPFVLSPSNDTPTTWRFAQSQPGSDWSEPEFDDTDWEIGEGGFGGWWYGRPDRVGTLWETVDLWARTTFEVGNEDVDGLAIHGRWDDTIEVYINGALAASVPRWTPTYRFLRISDEAKATIVPGTNLIAVHCHDTGGGRYLDVGIAPAPFDSLPTSGSVATCELEVFSDAVRSFMEEHYIPAGVLAVMKGNRVVVRRAFGYMDKEMTRVLSPHAVLRLASNDKLVTKGAIMELIAKGANDPVTGAPINANTHVFELFAARGILPPAGVVPDPRIYDVTIQHLMDHASGIAPIPWYPPDFYDAIGAGSGMTTPEDSISYLFGAPLSFAPGESDQYSSTGFFVLRYLIEMLTGDLKTFLDDVVLAPVGTTDMYISSEILNGRHPREPWYATKETPYDRWIFLEDFLALSSTADAMVRYLRRYHLAWGTPLEDPITGEWAPVPDNGGGVFFGSMAGTWSVAVQRRWEELSYAVIFNQGGVYDEIYYQLEGIAKTFSSDRWGQIELVELLGCMDGPAARANASCSGSNSDLNCDGHTDLRDFARFVLHMPID